MNYINIVLLVLGVGLMSGVVKSSTAEPCTANDKLIDIIKDQQGKLSDMLAESKRDADNEKKRYEKLIDDLAKTPCKK